MSRLLLIPTLVLLWGCGENKSAAELNEICGPAIAPMASANVIPTEPVPLSFRIRLTPAWYGSLPLSTTQWELISEKRGILTIEHVTTNAPRHPMPGPKGWYTFCRDGRMMVLFQEKEEALWLYHGSTFWDFESFGWIPRLLKQGMTWTSRRVENSIATEQSGSCVADGGKLRVDFSESHRVVHSMWFDPDQGLVRWDGIDASPIVQEPGNPTTFRLRTAARTYTRNGRVDDSKDAPPTDYIMHPPRPRLSASSDEATHGGKLVAMYARWRTNYDYVKEARQYDGQFIVLESWLPGAVREKGPLFLMLKSQGDWIYATATPDGEELTAWGKLPACTKCHEAKATRDCLFGPWPEEEPH